MEADDGSLAAGWWLFCVVDDAGVAVIILVSAIVILLVLIACVGSPEVRAVVIVFLSELAGDEEQA